MFFIFTDGDLFPHPLLFDSFTSAAILTSLPCTLYPVNSLPKLQYCHLLWLETQLTFVALSHWHAGSTLAAPGRLNAVVAAFLHS